MQTKVVTDKLSISLASDNRNTAQVEVRANRDTYACEVGEDFHITAPGSGLRLFGGTVDDVDMEVRFAPNKQTVLNVYAVGYDQILDRLIVAANFQELSLGELVTTIWERYLDGEGVTLGTIEDGPPIANILIPYQKITDIFQSLMDLTGYQIYIDAYKVLHCIAKGTNQSPFDIDTSLDNSQIQTLKIRKTRERYRNQQYIRGAKSLTDVRTEILPGDGENKAFLLKFPVGVLVGIVRVNGLVETDQTFDLQGQTGSDFYYTKNSNTIAQDDAGTALALGETLEITYQGLFPSVLQSRNQDEIDARAVVEGGTGLYEDVNDDDTNSTILGQVEAASKAEALLNRYGILPIVAEFQTTTAGLEVGQTIRVSSDEYGLSAVEFLIQTIDVEYFTQEKLLYKVTALAGDNLDSWFRFYRAETKAVNLGDGSEPLVLAQKFTQQSGMVAGDSVHVAQGPAFGSGSFSLSPSHSLSPSSSESSSVSSSQSPSPSPSASQSPSASVSPSSSTSLSVSPSASLSPSASPSISPSASQSPSASKSPSSSTSSSPSASQPPLLWGKETLESGSTPYSFDTLGTIFDNAFVAIDTTSKVNGVNSLRLTSTGSGGAGGLKDLLSLYDDLYFQFSVFIPTAFTWGASGFITIVAIGAATDVDDHGFGFNLEDFGVPKLTITDASGISGIPFTQTVDIAKNTKTKIEVRIRKSATVGQIQVWFNNNVQGSPDFDSGIIDTGASQMQNFGLGMPFAPEAISTPFYMDDMAVDISFIGNRTA